MKICDIVYSEEYHAVGKLVEIIGKEAQVDLIDSPEEDIIYCDVSKLRLATHSEIHSVFDSDAKPQLSGEHFIGLEAKALEKEGEVDDSQPLTFTFESWAAAEIGDYVLCLDNGIQLVIDIQLDEFDNNVYIYSSGISQLIEYATKINPELFFDDI